MKALAAGVAILLIVPMTLLNPLGRDACVHQSVDRVRGNLEILSRALTIEAARHDTSAGGVAHWGCPACGSVLSRSSLGRRPRALDSRSTCPG